MRWRRPGSSGGIRADLTDQVVRRPTIEVTTGPLHDLPTIGTEDFKWHTTTWQMFWLSELALPAPRCRGVLARPASGLSVLEQGGLGAPNGVPG